MAALETGAAAKLVSFSWLAHRNRILERFGIPGVTANPPQARFRFGDGRLGEVRHAADVPVGIAGNKGMFTAFELDGDVPALLRDGDLEALRVQWDFLRGSLNLRRQGEQITVGLDRARRYILSVVDFRRGSSRSASASPEEPA